MAKYVKCTHFYRNYDDGLPIHPHVGEPAASVESQIHQIHICHKGVSCPFDTYDINHVTWPSADTEVVYTNMAICDRRQNTILSKHHSSLADIVLRIYQ